MEIGRPRVVFVTTLCELVNSLSKSGFSQIGSDVHQFVFSKAGPISVQIENVGDDRDSFSEFNSIVYENPNGSEARTQAATAIKAAIFLPIRLK